MISHSSSLVSLATQRFYSPDKGVGSGSFTPNLGSANLVLNEDGGIYHLGLKPEQLADNVLVFGDPKRAFELANAIGINLEDPTTLVTGTNQENRSLVTISGYVEFNGKRQRVSLVTHGMGTSSEIIFNEIRALRDIDFASRSKIDQNRIKPLTVVRVGTSGSIAGDNLGSIIVTSMACDFTGVSSSKVHKFNVNELTLAVELNDYLKTRRVEAARKRAENPLTIIHTQARPYEVDPKVLTRIEQLASDMEIPIIKGMTASAAGFFSNQGRDLFADSNYDLAFGVPMDQVLREFTGPNGEKFANFEMEAGILESVFRGSVHSSATICVAVANRVDNTFSHSELTSQAIDNAGRLALALMFDQDR
jgi:uridine phosphorylase